MKPRNYISLFFALLGILALVILAGCSALPFGLGSGTGTSAPVSTTIPGAQALQLVEPQNLWRFGWLSFALVFVFPAIRKPIVSLWTAIFNALALPFLVIRRWYDEKVSR